MRSYLTEDEIEDKFMEHLSAHAVRWERMNCFQTKEQVKAGVADGSGRKDKSEVVLEDKLHTALKRLNPTLPEEAISDAQKELTKSRKTLSGFNANKEIYSYLRQGIQVHYLDKKGKTKSPFVKILDFNTIENNEFTAVQQLWIKGELGFRRPDVILYVNGLPLVLIELKNMSVSVENAYTDNLTKYKKELPQLFWYNAVTVLSNGKESRVGSYMAEWSHFGRWLRMESEKESPDQKEMQRKGNSLKYIADSLFLAAKLLDYIENFVLYHENGFKICAKNHQFLGVNNAVKSFENRAEKDGRLGVFWHTQGSGKSYSMVMLTRKVFRKFRGDFTFLVITDRDDLNTQIYKNFVKMGACTDADTAQPKNSKALREVLQQNKKYIFTLIQKFRYEKGEDYPMLSDRSDIVVIIDEGHRTQYSNLADNLRVALPNAQFMAFTGTPLLGTKEKTYEWFGQPVSEYNFKQAIEDGATVPLYYDKRLPEIHLNNDDLADDLEELLEEENLSEQQKEKLENKFAKEVEAITREDRLNLIAQDIAQHFPRRGYLGKAMVVCVDKFTTVKMYHKVEYAIKAEIAKLRSERGNATTPEEKAELKLRLDFLRKTEMAVIISEDGDEKERFEKKGINTIEFHRKRLKILDEEGADVEDNFKNAEHPLRIVFVCAMWLTGFDAQTVSTLYLDKPMKGHTLMQAIARANRVAPNIFGQPKINGLVVDYYNVFRNLKRALTDYGGGTTSGEKGGDKPIESKSRLFELLTEAIKTAQAFLVEQKIDLQLLLDSPKGFKDADLLDEFADILLDKDEIRKEFYVYDNTCTGLYDACRPDIFKVRSEYKIAEAIAYLRKIVDNYVGKVDISHVEKEISQLLDESVVTTDDAKNRLLKEEVPAYGIKGYKKVLDLSKLNVDKLRKEFPKKKRKNIEITHLRAFLDKKLEQMLAENATRTPFIERFKAIIDRYNAGSMTQEDFYDDLLNFTENLSEEEERRIRLGLSEDELELFDLLSKEKLTQKEEQALINASKHLFKRLKEEHPFVLVQDWHKDTVTKQRVKSAIEDVLDNDLPETYDRRLFAITTDKIYEHIYIQAAQGLKGWNNMTA